MAARLPVPRAPHPPESPPAAGSPAPDPPRDSTEHPRGPGVYLFKDPRGEVIYVGKSRNLHRRIQDHLRLRDEKDRFIQRRLGAVEFIPTQTEREALLLEATLVRQHQPRYNVLLKDDKSFPYLAMTLGDPVPRILFVRRPSRREGWAIFGPYTSAREARRLATVLSEAFQLRRCTRLPARACLYYHLGTCSAPCIGAVDPAAYRERVDGALQVLRGRAADVLPQLREEMRTAALHQDFERAAVLRDALLALESLRERQSVVDTPGARTDVLDLAWPPGPRPASATVGLIRVRAGNVVGAEPHRLTLPPEGAASRGRALRSFLLQYYPAHPDPPRDLWVPVPPLGQREVARFLQEQRGIRLHVGRPTRSPGVARLAQKLAGARQYSVPEEAHGSALRSLMTLLRLPRLPRHIEGVDISLFQGVEAVGSSVVFRNGEPSPSEYRRYRIRTVVGTDDFAMIREVVSRRIHRLLAEEEPLPDLLLIDGGKGQVSHAREALHALGAEDLPLVGLAKREEELFLPGRPEPVPAHKNSPAVLLLRRVRDEAHRFAVTYHRTRRRMRLREEVAVASRAPGESPGAPTPRG